MKVLKRLKSPVRITSYIPPKVIGMTTSQIEILKKLNIPIEAYAREVKKELEYKNRYGG
jgi:hypothetical protein